MADLDDFFAKKDRKRNKGQKKTEEGKKETARERPRPRDGEEPRPGDEEEWKEYEETVKDYTGLKIQVLQGGAAGGGSNESGPVGDESAVGPDCGKVKGPWNKPELPDSGAEEEPAPAPPKREPPPPPTAAPKAGVYKAPGSRRVADTPEPETRRRQQNRHAPDIHNADYFPVLGASGGAAKRGGGWNTATGPQASARPAVQQRRPLALDNRFTSLQDDS